MLPYGSFKYSWRYLYVCLVFMLPSAGNSIPSPLSPFLFSQHLCSTLPLCRAPPFSPPWSLFTFLVSTVTPHYMVISKNLELGFTNTKGHEVFIFLCLGSSLSVFSSSTHLHVDFMISLFFRAEQCSTVYTYHVAVWTKCIHWVMYLNTRSPVDGAVWWGLGGTILSKEIHHKMWAFR